METCIISTCLVFIMSQETEKLLPLKSTLERVSCSRSHWYDLIAEGLAPRPVKVGSASRWSSVEIDQYIEGLKNSREAAA